ncbi:MAG: putative DNA binding domain-containing protein [Bacteroidetes bacterium]|nr:putative DNA binding domain-containing protein [Bacteroidota bacterium]MBS1740239.1 putative DNA binding domain-containing protein [Bacteroidota bacterium]
MSEHQNIEYKSSWRDEYLKWICGFANANGGTIFIGKDDNGKVVGVNDAKKLLEDIPNKVRDVLGILVDVNLHQTKQGDYLEIVVEPYPNAISYKGQYHYRSGSTKQELKGSALEKFLLQKKGKHWDSSPIPNVAVFDLKQDTFEFFKKRGIRSKRLDEESLNDTPEQLLENLELTEGKYLKRAALLLFHPKPEKFVTGAYIKIGYFENDADLIFQDEVHGNLFEQVEKTLDMLFTKYIKAIISYENKIHRIETYEYPKDAIREALLNAIAHKDYSSGSTIQISVYKDKIMIWNAGQLPENWTIETLLQKHSSSPYNPDIANTFFRSGYIESWGRGINKMTILCIEAGLPKPEFDYQGSGMWTIFRKDIYNAEHLQTLGLNDRQIKAVLYTKENGRITNSKYQQLNKITDRTALRDLENLISINIFKRVGEKKGAYYELFF